MTDAQSPSWPAWAHDKRWSWVLADLRPLSVVEQEYHDSGKLLEVRLVDSELRLFRLSGAEQVGYAGIFGWRPGHKGRYVNVRPSVTLERQLDVEEAREYILQFLRKHPEVHASRLSTEEIEEALAPVTRGSELIATLQHL